MTLDATATTIPSPISSNIPEPRPGRLASEQSNTPQSTHNKQIGQPYCAESGLRATIKDFAKARGQRPQNRGNACAPASHAAIVQCAWELGLVAGYALREREVVGSIPAVPRRTHRTICANSGQSRDALTPDAGQ